MKKIVFLRLDLDAIGGAQRYLSRLVKALKDSGVACETRGFNGSKQGGKRARTRFILALSASLAPTSTALATACTKSI